MIRFVIHFTMIIAISLSKLESQTASFLNKGLEATTYTHNASKQEEWALEFFKAKYNISGHEKKILDIGSGDGVITVKIAKLFANQFPRSSVEFIGIDVSQSMIDKAKADYPKEQYKNISFLIGNAEEMAYQSCFDLVVSFSTLHFAMNQDKALKEIYNSLTPGGTVLILVPSKNAHNMNPLAGTLMMGCKWKAYFPQGYTPTRVYFTSNEYKKLMEKVGFTSTQIETISKEDIYPSKEAFIHSLIAVLNYVPENIRRDFAIDLANLLNIYEDEQGAIHHSHQSLQIVGIK